MSAKSGNSLATVLVAAAVVAALYFGREVLLPMALAVLLSFVLAPAVKLLQRLYLPRFAAVTIVVLLAFGVIFGLWHPDVYPGQSTGWGFTALSIEFSGENTGVPRRDYCGWDSRTGFPGAAEPAERTRSAEKRKTNFSCNDAGGEHSPG